MDQAWWNYSSQSMKQKSQTFLWGPQRPLRIPDPLFSEHMGKEWGKNTLTECFILKINLDEHLTL